MTTFTVHGNYGQLTVKISTGVVVQYQPNKEGQTDYADIIRFDIEEYAAEYPAEDLEWVDICDIGFWTTAGEYEPPVFEYRAMNESMRKEEQAREEMFEAACAVACELAAVDHSPESSQLEETPNAGAARAAHLVLVVDNVRGSHSSVIGGPSSGT